MSNGKIIFDCGAQVQKGAKDNKNKIFDMGWEFFFCHSKSWIPLKRKKVSYKVRGITNIAHTLCWPNATNKYKNKYNTIISWQ